MGFLILDKNGNKIGWVETQEEADDLLAQVPEDIYTFYIGGSAEDAEKQILKFNDAGEFEASFVDLLREKYGVVPSQISPFEEIKDTYLRDNSFFIKLRYDKIDTRLAGRLLSVLRRTVPAGSNFFVIVEKQEIAEELDLSPTEDIDVFYAVDVDESTTPTITETVLKESII